MARKSSKTAHVLNLLSGGEEKTEQEVINNEDKKSDSPIPGESSEVITENLQATIKNTIEHTIKDTIQDTLKQKEPLPEVNITATQASIKTTGSVMTQTEDNTNKTEPQPSLAPSSLGLGEDPLAELIKSSLIEEHKEIMDIPEEENANSIVSESSSDAENSDTLPSSEEIIQKEPVSVNPTAEHSVAESDENAPTPDVMDSLSIDEENSIETADIKAANPEEQEDVSVEPSIKEETEAPLGTLPIESNSFEPAATQDQEEKPSDSMEEPDIPYQYVNVMEYVVKDKVLYYMEQFGMCTCKHCIADTTALSLTHLPPKYVVVDKLAVSPLLSFYSNKFVGQVTVELTKACITVKDFPHHDD